MILDFLKDVSYSWLLAVYAIDFALISSFFNYRSLLKKKQDDFKAFIRYFIYFFILLFVIPLVFVIISFSRPFETLKSLGLQIGDFKLGMLTVLIGAPIIAVIVFIAVKDPVIREQYPYSKKACENPKKFILYEISYLVFFYVAWEFTFRGVFLFALIDIIGDNSTGIITAILIQSIIATVYHLGHPNIEIIGALLGSIIFGIIAYSTQSILYPILLHAPLGILYDTLIYLRYHKNGKKL